MAAISFFTLNSLDGFASSACSGVPDYSNFRTGALFVHHDHVVANRRGLRSLRYLQQMLLLARHSCIHGCQCKAFDGETLEQ